MVNRTKEKKRKFQTSGIWHVFSISNYVTIECFACWACSHCPVREDISETEAVALSETRCFAVGVCRVIRQEATWPSGAWLQPLELLYRSWALTIRRSEAITESNPLALGPGHWREGVNALRRAGSGRAFDGINWLRGLGDGSTLGPRWCGLKYLERVFGWIPGRGCGWRERGDVFGVLALCQVRRALLLWHRVSWRR